MSGAAYAEKAFLNGFDSGPAASGFLNGLGLGARSCTALLTLCAG